MKKAGSFLILIMYVLLGILIALQYKTTLYSKKERAATSLSLEKLIAQVNEEKKTEEELLAKIDEYNRKKEEYLESYIEINDDNKLRELWNSINDLRMKAGLVDVEGPGLIIEMDDALTRDTDKPSKLIIHDGDLRIIVNELKSAGAQAISIKGERIVAMSELVCAGPTIIINKERYAVPYVIHVIGPPDALYESMMKSDRINRMRKEGIRITITKVNRVVVPKYNKNLTRAINKLEVVK